MGNGKWTWVSGQGSGLRGQPSEDYGLWSMDYGLGMRAQTTLEYLLVLGAILLAILAAVQDGGPVRAGVASVMSDAATVISGMATDAASRF